MVCPVGVKSHVRLKKDYFGENQSLVLGPLAAINNAYKCSDITQPTKAQIKCSGNEVKTGRMNAFFKQVEMLGCFNASEICGIVQLCEQLNRFSFGLVDIIIVHACC